MANQKGLLLGLDIGDHAIKLIQLRWEQDGFSLERLGRGTLDEGVMRAGEIGNEDALIEAIQKLMAQEDVKETRVAVSLSGGGVALRTVWVPETAKEEMESLIAWEGEQYLPSPIEDLNLDYVIQGETDEEGKRWLQVLLAGARKPFVDKYRDVISRAGLKPIVMDCTPLALENGFEASGSTNGDDSFLLLDIGSQLTYAHTVSGGLSLLTHHFLLGGDDYTRAVQEGLDVDFDRAETIKCGGDPDHSVGSLSDYLDPVTDRIASDLKRFLTLYEAEWGNLPIQAIILSGGGGRLQGLEDRLAQTLELPVEIANPFAQVSFSDQEFDPDFVASMAPISVIAMGLAVRSVEG